MIGSFSLDSYYNAKVAIVGADSQTFQQQSDNQDAVVTQLKNQQSSVSGVNLDEELTHMLAVSARVPGRRPRPQYGRLVSQYKSSTDLGAGSVSRRDSRRWVNSRK